MKSRHPFVAIAASVLLVILVSSVVLAGPEKVCPRLRQFTHPHLFNGMVQFTIKTMSRPGAAPGSSELIRCLIKADLSREQLESEGVIITCQIGTIFTAWIPGDRIVRLSDMPEVVRIQAARPVRPMLDLSLSETGVTPGLRVPDIYNPSPFDHTGNGTIVGIVDTGIDWSHPDFDDSSAPGSTRIQSIWDHTDYSGTPPAGKSYGTEWTQADIAGGLCTSFDFDGHGTHVAGAAAKIYHPSNPVQLSGAAPDATLVVVKFDFDGARDTDASVIDGIEYIFGQAISLGQPAVINLSLGSDFGPHDGTTLEEQALDGLAGPGRLVVAAAGNNGDSIMHWGGLIPPGSMPDSISLLLELFPYSPEPGPENDYLSCEMWYAGVDTYALKVRSPMGTIVGPVPRGDVFSVELPGEGTITIENGVTTPENGDVEAYIWVHDLNESNPPCDGIWTFSVSSIESSGEDIHLWVNDGNIPYSLSGDNSYSVGFPATAFSSIAVGAYTTKPDWISYNGLVQSWGDGVPPGELIPSSGRGPTRDGRIKPDITAPGTVASALSSERIVDPSTDPYLCEDGEHYMMRGTSMAAAHVTGLVAILLEQDPTLTPETCRSILAETARSGDGFVPPVVPDNDWGYGKLWAECADVRPPEVMVIAPNGGESFPEGAPVDIFYDVTDNFDAPFVDIHYSIGSGPWNEVVLDEPNAGMYPWTAPGPPSDSVMVRVTAKDNRENEGQDQSDDYFMFDPSTGIEEDLLPEAAFLSQNWPNPFNPNTTIRFGLVKPGDVSLRIYDAAGRLVREITDRHVAAGFYEITWNGRDSAGLDVASGVYFYRLHAPGFEQTRKMILLR